MLETEPTDSCLTASHALFLLVMNTALKSSFDVAIPVSGIQVEGSPCACAFKATDAANAIAANTKSASAICPALLPGFRNVAIC
jgi:hypothetical protein